MTRTFTLALAAATPTWYNLWDLIIAGIVSFDPTYTNSAFLPSNVHTIQIQSDVTGSSGKIVTVASKNDTGGTRLIAGQATQFNADGNGINVKDFRVQTDVAGAQIHVHLESN